MGFFRDKLRYYSHWIMNKRFSYWQLKHYTLYTAVILYLTSYKLYVDWNENRPTRPMSGDVFEVYMQNQTGPFQRVQKVTPPLKGSFPLDHESECRSEMFKYMRCINENKGMNEQCRPLAKLYLGCRMDKGLMERDDWSRLGFKDDEISE